MVTVHPQMLVDLQESVRSSLLEHIRAVHKYEPPAHQKELWIPALEDMRIKRLLIIAPPKFGKTPMVGLDYLGWRIGRNPNYHVIYVSNTAPQAHKPSVALRDTIAFNQKYRMLYGVTPDVAKGWGESEWFVKREDVGDKDPTLQATGVGGPILGATVEEVIFDDVADPENMATAYQREKVNEWLRQVPMSRLIPNVGRAVMIATRWHEEDPAASFEHDGWTKVQLPALDSNGESTYPSYWTVESLDARRIDLGLRNFELMFQGRVLPAEGGIFKHEWWRYWKRDQGHPAPIMIVQSWDTAFKEKRTNDYCAMETWIVAESGFYLIDAWRGKVAFPDLKRVVVQLYEQHTPEVILIEDAASGQSLIQELRANTRLPVLAIKVDRDKQSRANAVTALCEAGKVFLPWEAPWRVEWEVEHETFPAAAHDDWVDCTSQVLNWARYVTAGRLKEPKVIEKKSTWKF